MEKINVWNKEFTLAPNQNYQITSPSGKGKSTFTAFCYGLRNDFKGELQVQLLVFYVDSNGQYSNLENDKFLGTDLNKQIPNL